MLNCLFFNSSVTAAPGDTQEQAIDKAQGSVQKTLRRGRRRRYIPTGIVAETAHYSQPTLRLDCQSTSRPWRLVHSTYLPAQRTPQPMSTPHARYRSKTLATWLAVMGGTLGLHRLYLKGVKDPLGWLHLPPTLLGLAGVIRMRQLGQDDQLAWVLIPVLGLMISFGMLCAILYGLTPDEKWDATRNPGHEPTRTAWGPVLGVIAALLVGAAILMGTIAFSIQKLFEWDLAATKGAQVSSSVPR